MRRYQRVLEQGGPFPDLIVIDGGKGQLSAAYAALRDVGLDRLVAIGLAKEEELIFTRDRVEGLALPRESPRCDCCSASATKRTVSPSRSTGKRATKRDFSSVLDEIAGVGAPPAQAAARRRSDRWPACGAPVVTNSRASSAGAPPTRSFGTSARDIVFSALPNAASSRPALSDCCCSRCRCTRRRTPGRRTASAIRRRGSSGGSRSIPLAHIDWIGTVLFPLIAMLSGLPLFGWAKPVPVEWRNLKSPAA